MTNQTIASLKGHRVKKFEKEIRRYFEKKSNLVFVVNGVEHQSIAFNAYVFKNVLDKMHNEDDLKDPINTIIVYSRLLTLRNLKTDEYIPEHQDEYQDFLHVINNYHCFIIHIYNHNFLHKPEKPYCIIMCAINKKRKAIVPIRFTRDLAIDYPKWFDGKLEHHDKIDVGIDLNLIEKIEMALE